MKDSKNIFAFALSLTLLASCAITTSVEHHFSEEWSSDSKNHWHKCTDEGCKQISDKESHKWGSWRVTEDATPTSDGFKERTCKTCGYVEEEAFEYVASSSSEPTSSSQQSSEEHVHTWDSAWTSDETYHWHKCTGTVSGGNTGWGGWGGWGGSSACTEVNDKAEHTFDNGVVTTAATAYGDGVKTYTCTVCSYKKTETIPATGPSSEETKGNFTFGTDLNTVQEIHTTDQANFLKYNKDYYNITSSELNSYNATGTAENSFPNQVKVTWGYTAPAGKTVTTYSVVLGQKDDLSDGIVLKGTSSKELKFYNPYLGTNYFKVMANLNDGTYEVSDIKTFKVNETAPRNLKIGNMSNCRDMGGRTTIAGGKIKQGLIFRTSDPSGNVTDEVKEVMLNQFKVKSEIYVKDGGTDGPSPLGSSVKYFNCSMDYGATPYSNLSRNAERLRKVFSVLGDVNNYPTFYHCRIGTDRTGICGVAINGLLGVPFNEVIQDYAFSNFGKIDGQRYAHKTPDTNGDDIAKYIDEILAMPGNNFQEQTYNSLLTIGIPASTLNTVIDILTEGNKATLPTSSNVVLADKLTNNGGSKKTASDYKNPNTYIEVSGSSQSVSTTLDVTTAGKYKVVVYLGCTDSSDSKKLATGIDLKIDGTSQTIVDKTYFKAGFGKTQQSSRTGYMFNILGEYELTAGSHTISVAGKNSDKFNIGTLATFAA